MSITNNRGIYKASLVTDNPQTEFIPSKYLNSPVRLHNFKYEEGWFTEPVEIEFIDKDNYKTGLDGTQFNIEVIWGPCKGGDILRHKEFWIFVVEKLKNSEI